MNDFSIPSIVFICMFVRTHVGDIFLCLMNIFNTQRDIYLVDTDTTFSNIMQLVTGGGFRFSFRLHPGVCVSIPIVIFF